MNTTLTKLLASILLSVPLSAATAGNGEVGQMIDLPAVDRQEGGAFFDLLFRRQSTRSFEDESIDLPQLSRLLFAGQGITRDDRFRTVPSGGAQYPIDIYVVAGDVEGLDAGIYRYVPHGHLLERIADEDRRTALAEASLSQDWMAAAPVMLVISAEYSRITGRYGERGERYAVIESGCTAQNISLECADLGLGATVVGAFHDERVARLIEAPEGVAPLMIMPIGVPARDHR